MELEALKKLTRSELQKLAKSMGVRAVGKTADIIQRLCDTSKAQAARGNNANYVDETERVRKTNTSASATAVNAPWDGNSEAASEPVSENHEENERMIPAAGKSRPVDTSPHAMPKRLRQTVQLNSRRTNTASPAVRAQSGQEASEQSDGGTEGERASHPATNRSVRPAIMRFGDFMENGAASQGEVTCDGQHDIAAGGSVSKPVSPSASEVRPEAAERLPASVTRPGEHFPPDVQGTGQAHTAPRSRTSSPITNREAIPPTFSKFRGNRVARTDTARREHSEIVAGPSGNHRGPSTSSPPHLAAAEQLAASVTGTEREIQQVSSLLTRRAAPNGGSSAAASQPVWTPIVVGEREGEPGYSQSAARQSPWTQRQPRGSPETTLPATSPASRSSHIQRPQNVPRMYDEHEDSDSSKRGRAPAYFHPLAPSPNANHSEKFGEQPEDENGRPTRRQFRDELWQISERARKYPKIQMEVHQLHGVMNVIRTKEAWMEARMEEIQRLRLAIQKHYVTKVKSNPALLGRTHWEQTHEEEFFLGEEAQEDAVQPVEDTQRDEPLAPLAPSPRKEERTADESELAMVENVPRKASS